MRTGIRLLTTCSLLVAGALVTPANAATDIGATGATEKYLVLYRANDVPADAATSIARAGGTLVAAYDEIGVAVASSDSTSFAATLRRDRRVEGATATTRFATRIATPAGDDAHEGDLPNAPATDGDTYSALQWDMRQIKAPEAHAITGGSPSVVVGNIDTGLDKDHPDLIANIDFSRSASCESGAPDQNPAAWDDRHGHGTHTGGTIAAAANGIGIVGVAPNVKIAGIKSSTDEGYFFPEMVVCSFMWAARSGIDVTNNSYFADPWLFNCRNDAEQRTIWKAEQRAIRYAMTNGVTVVASEGNASTDLSHPRFDDTSPDFPPGSEQEREITNACVVVPVEIPGVVGVTAVGNGRQTPDGYLKSFYSNYGVSTADLTAPGGDSRYPTAEAPNGRVLSTYPAEAPCLRRLEESANPLAAYCYLQGTSMAGPHVAGVAALIVSRYGDASSPQNGKLRPGTVESYLQQTADRQPCPDSLPAFYALSPQSDGSPQECQGGRGHNSWYGAGQVNALTAVTR
jgi:lantibiotic leader peptide-processing serine protease